MEERGDCKGVMVRPESELSEAREFGGCSTRLGSDVSVDEGV